MAEIEAKCQCCGKPVSVLEPSRWGYKVKEKNGWIYYCSWKCLRAEEKRIEQAEQKKKEARKAKQQEKFLNNRLEVLKGMMEAVSEGKNAYDYLKSMGYADPKDTLRRLRITAKEEAPKIYRKMEKMGLLDLRKGHSGKGVDRMSQNKLTREQKGKAVDIAIQGGDPLAYLRECGAKNPTAAWWYIKKTLATKNPQLLEKIPEKIGTVLNESGQVAARVEIAEKLPPEAAAEVPEEMEPEFQGEKGLVIDQYGIRYNGHVIAKGGPLPGVEQPMMEKPEETTIAGEEKEQLDELTRDGMPLDEAMEEVKERLKGARVKLGKKHKTIGDAFEELAQNIQEGLNPTKKPVNYDGFEIMCIKGEFGEYRTDGRKFNFANAPKIMYFEMNKEDLAAFLDEIRRAAQILGVDAG